MKSVSLVLWCLHARRRAILESYRRVTTHGHTQRETSQPTYWSSSEESKGLYMCIMLAQYEGGLNSVSCQRSLNNALKISIAMCLQNACVQAVKYAKYIADM